MIECGAHACTDVTGFGLMGHLGAMAAASGVDVEIVWDDLPLLPGVLRMSGRGNRFRGGRSGIANRRAAVWSPTRTSSRPCSTCVSIRRLPAGC